MCGRKIATTHLIKRWTCGYFSLFFVFSRPHSRGRCPTMVNSWIPSGRKAYGSRPRSLQVSKLCMHAVRIAKDDRSPDRHRIYTRAQPTAALSEQSLLHDRVCPTDAPDPPGAICLQGRFLQPFDPSITCAVATHFCQAVIYRFQHEALDTDIH